jgi:hypothetical protein
MFFRVQLQLYRTYSPSSSESLHVSLTTPSGPNGGRSDTDHLLFLLLLRLLLFAHILLSIVLFLGLLVVSGVARGWWWTCVAWLVVLLRPAEAHDECGEVVGSFE